MTTRGTSLRVTVVHDFYGTERPSGENEAVMAHVQLLQEAGHDVQLAAAYTDELQARPLYRARAMVTQATGLGISPLEDIRSHRPHVIHVHNLDRNLGRTWVHRAPAPVVATLHNYRPLCANAILYREGRVCTDCVDGNRISGLVHACYRNKRTATLPLTVGQGGRMRVLERAEALIALSEVQRAFYVRAGVPEHKLHVIPNFLPDPLDPGPGPGGDAWLFAGRLSADKGFPDLLREWPAEVPLVVAGVDDDMSPHHAAAAGKQVEFVGRVTRAEVVGLLGKSRGLAFPSRSPESFGLVYLEALATGTPVLATPPSAVSRLVLEDGTGVTADKVTADVVRSAHGLFAGLRGRARETFENRYTASRQGAALVDLYGSVIA